QFSVQAFVEVVRRRFVVGKPPHKLDEVVDLVPGSFRIEVPSPNRGPEVLLLDGILAQRRLVVRLFEELSPDLGAKYVLEPIVTAETRISDLFEVVRDCVPKRYAQISVHTLDLDALGGLEAESLREQLRH